MVNLAADAIERGEPRAARACSAAFRPSIPAFIRNMERQVRAGSCRCGRGARLSARLESLDHSRMAGKAATRSARSRDCRCGSPRWASPLSAPRRCRSSACKRTAELLIGRAERIHWYSLYDLPRAWPATTRHREAEGSSYYRHFYMGLLREDGAPKLALRNFLEYTPELGICQWFHFEDHRLDDAVRWLRDLGVRHLRTGLSWADSFRPGAEHGSTGR